MRTPELVRPSSHGFTALGLLAAAPSRDVAAGEFLRDAVVTVEGALVSRHATAFTDGARQDHLRFGAGQLAVEPVQLVADTPDMPAAADPDGLTQPATTDRSRAESARPCATCPIQLDRRRHRVGRHDGDRTERSNAGSGGGPIEGGGPMPRIDGDGSRFVTSSGNVAVASSAPPRAPSASPPEDTSPGNPSP